MRRVPVLFLVLVLLATGQETPENTGNEDIEVAESEGEQHEFQADVARVMDILINSLYTNKEIFLRETISNASDALDKIRFMSISDDSVLGESEEQKRLEIRVEFDKDARTLSVTDTGIGMTKMDLVKNLGTVAKSGTTSFIEALASGGDINLIGQFGVGFYSNFLVADKITVTSKHNDDDQHIWISQATNTFNVLQDPRGNSLLRGTRVTLLLKQDAEEFLDEIRLKRILQKYSEFLQYPIYLKVQKEVSREVPLTEEELAQQSEEKTTKVIKEKVWEWEPINENKPLWLRDDVEDEEYTKFYQTLSKDTKEPLTYIHFTAEGEVEFKALLYIPSEAPYDLFDGYYAKNAPIKLYVRRVLVTDEFTDLVPRYMNFIKGVVDSDDMPLNVSRENLQQTKILKLINKKIIRKILQSLNELAEDEEETEKYLTFYKSFGKNIKLGVMDDPGNKAKLARLLRFYSSNNVHELTSLNDYISRMKESQEDIYFIAGEDRTKLDQSPLIQQLKKKGYEVLLLDDPIDEYTVNSLNEYEKHKLQNVAKNDWKLGDEDDLAKKKEKKLKEMYSVMADWFKGIIAPAAKDVVVSNKLVDEPSVVTTGEEGYSANMERLTRAQAFASYRKKEDHNNAPKTWEVNPAHPLVKRMKDYARTNPNDKMARGLVETLYDMALINSGFVIPNPTNTYKRIQSLVSEDMGIAEDAKLEEPEVELDEEEEVAEESKESTENLDQLPKADTL